MSQDLSAIWGSQGQFFVLSLKRDFEEAVLVLFLGMVQHEDRIVEGSTYPRIVVLGPKYFHLNLYT